MNKRWLWMLLGGLALLAGGVWFWAQTTPALAAPEEALALYAWEWDEEEVAASQRPGPGKNQRRAWCRPEITRETFLAQALGISEEQLHAAQREASLAWIDYLVSEGRLDETKADLWRARVLVRPYLDPQALVAQALGLSVEEVQQACAEGKTLADLLEQQGMDRRTFVQALQQAADEALQQAVADGVITEEQADALRQWWKQHRRHGPRPQGQPPRQAPAFGPAPAQP